MKNPAVTITLRRRDPSPADILAAPDQVRKHMQNDKKAAQAEDQLISAEP